MQHFYVQRISKWEIADLNEDKIEYEPTVFYNNHKVLDTLLGRTDGIFNIIGQASKLEYNGKYIIGNLNEKKNTDNKIKLQSFFRIHIEYGLWSYNNIETYGIFNKPLYRNN